MLVKPVLAHVLPAQMPLHVLPVRLDLIFTTELARSLVLLDSLLATKQNHALLVHQTVSLVGLMIMTIQLVLNVHQTTSYIETNALKHAQVDTTKILSSVGVLNADVTAQLAHHMMFV